MGKNFFEKSQQVLSSFKHMMLRSEIWPQTLVLNQIKQGFWIQFSM